MGPVVDRAKQTTALLAALTGPGSEAVGLTTTLEGAGGFGKTTLAAYVCRSPEVVKRFPGGLLWATIGEHRKGAELADEICRLCEILSGERPGTADPWVAGSRLGELLDRREPTLMVVDDVWTKTQLEPFLIGGPTCRRLVTTRNVGIVPRDGVTVPVDEMSVDEAVATVTAGAAGMQSGVVDRLVRLAGRWPVLLGLINAAIVGHVQAGASLDDAAVWVADRLERDGPTAVDVDDPESRDQAVSSTMAASLRLLNTWERDRYLDLAIFPEDAVIDDQTLNLLWGATSQANIEACRRLRSKLTRLRLASARWHSSSPALSLHDVIRAYLLHEIGGDGLMATHSRFVEAARAALGPNSSSAWYSLPDEVLYLWQFIPYHLNEAGHLEELALLVSDLRWVEAKIQRLGSPAPIVTDLGLMNTPRANLMQRALVEVAYLLAPATPISVLSATLVTRLDGISGLQEVVARYREGLARPRIDNRWQLPDRDDSSANVHAGTVVDCAVSPDGRLIVSASDDATIRLWDRQTGMFIRAFRGHTDRVRSCSFSPDGVLISSASADTTVRLWETATGRMVRALRGHTARVTSCCFSPDGALIASAGGDGTVRLWDAVTGAEVKVLRGHAGRVWSCTFSPDGATIVSGGADGTVRSWDVATGALTQSLLSHAAWTASCCFSPDGALIASAGGDGTVRLWDAVTGAEVKVLRGHAGRVWSCCFSPDGALIASAGGDGTVRLWDAVTGAEVKVLQGHAGRVWSCTFSPDGNLVVSAGDDAAVRFWDVSTRARIRVIRGQTGRVWCCNFSPNGALVVSAGDDGKIRIWDPAAGTLLRRMNSHEGWVLGCAFSFDGRLVVSSGDDGKIRIWDAAAGTLLREMNSHEGRVLACSFSPDGTLIASAGDDGTVRIWDRDTGVEIRTIRGEANEISDCQFSPDGGRIVSAGDDATLRIWETVTGFPVHTLQGHADYAWAGQFSPDGRHVVSGGADGTVRLWDVASGREVRAFRGHTGFVTGCTFSPDGGTIASVSSDHTVRIWDTATGVCLCGIRVAAPLTRCAWDPSGTALCATGQRGLYQFSYLR
ncbi:NB-ARC domain-containing protein [Frankia sp. Cj3]|uniref:NB-ARC domain-containing protein n=1 Tax=Frankia sp. Cj3 TaxID=2880976 RepID=UPI00351D42AB